MGPYQVLTLCVKVNLRLMAMKEYSTLPRVLKLEPHHLIQFSVITRTPLFSGMDVLSLCREYSQTILSPTDKTLKINN